MTRVGWPYVFAAVLLAASLVLIFSGLLADLPGKPRRFVMLAAHAAAVVSALYLLLAPFGFRLRRGPGT